MSASPHFPLFLPAIREGSYYPHLKKKSQTKQPSSHLAPAASLSPFDSKTPQKFSRLLSCLNSPLSGVCPCTGTTASQGPAGDTRRPFHSAVAFPTVTASFLFLAWTPGSPCLGSSPSGVLQSLLCCSLASPDLEMAKVSGAALVPSGSWGSLRSYGCHSRAVAPGRVCPPELQTALLDVSP